MRFCSKGIIMIKVGFEMGYGIPIPGIILFHFCSEIRNFKLISKFPDKKIDDFTFK